jgi:hypothetical protein
VHTNEDGIAQGINPFDAAPAPSVAASAPSASVR